MKTRIITTVTLLLAVCTSCFIDNDYKSTGFYLVNNCNQTIEVTSSAMVHYSFGLVENSLVDNVPSGATLWLRTINVVEDFSMSSVFTRIEIRKGNQLSTFDVMNRDNWEKTLTSDDKDEYTLFVDSTFFNNGKEHIE